ncbi:tyrosine-protein phosphatase [Aquitalea sp.]|uniref:tyrosine-protein phosphatase n=1 Tax=Aquitalea sp. TaxID=1872623 RepID=UPI0025868022|nr:tyrosine-protein phosphatase [Aquitalea sp.]
MNIITNFRDLGGIQNKHGKRLLQHRLFRSGELSQLSPYQSQQLVQRYQVEKIIDFRSADEVRQRPDIAIAETRHVHIDLLAEAQHKAQASIAAFSQLDSTARTQEFMLALYRELALSPAAQAGYRRFFLELLASHAQKSVLFHCAAGKDRTGIAAMLILETLEVPRTLIYQDYLQTNRMRSSENARLIAKAAAAGATPVQQAAFRVALQVDKQYLQRFYTTVEQHYDTMASYLQSVILIDPASKQQLQRRYLY